MQNYRGVLRRRAFVSRALKTLLAPISVWSARTLAVEPASHILQDLFGSTAILPSDRIELKIADLAEDGAIVPIHINCKLSGVESISIVADNNPVPLIARFHLQPPLRPVIGTRIKLAATTNVRIIVTTAKGTFETHKHVRVIQGGCDLPPAT